MNEAQHIHRIKLPTPHGREYIIGECACGYTRRYRAGHVDPDDKRSKFFKQPSVGQWNRWDRL